MSIEEAYRQVRRTGCVYGRPEELKAQLADIAVYLGTTDPIELGAALLLEQAGYERTQVQLQLDLAEETVGGEPVPRGRSEESGGTPRHAVVGTETAGLEAAHAGSGRRSRVRRWSE